jgi:multiple sugar transport system substrate-binding protein
MAMNFFAFLPGARQRGDQPERRRHRLLRQSGGPNGKQHARSGGQGISIVSYSDNQEER